MLLRLFDRSHIQIVSRKKSSFHALSFTLCLTFTFITFTLVNMKTLAEHMSETKTRDQALADMVKCDRSMITKIRLGKATPSLPLAVRISQKTGVPVESLIPRAEMRAEQ